MPGVRQTIDQSRLAEARRLYEQTDMPVREILAFMHMTQRTFYHRIKAWGWAPRVARTRVEPPGPPPPPPTACAPAPDWQPAERKPGVWIGKPCPGLGGCPERPALVSRLWAATEAHVTQLEHRLGQAVHASDARLLVTLAATLDKLVSLDRNSLRSAPGAAEPPAHDSTAFDYDATLARLANSLETTLNAH